MSVKVLVVDDSVVVRKVLSSELGRLPGVVVVGSAADPYEAREMIASSSPDVLTLDIDMPKMDGLTFLEKLMKHHPIPVVVVSSVSPEGSAMALRALSLGAVDVVPKPSSHHSLPDIAGRLARAVMAASVAKPLRRGASPKAPVIVPVGPSFADKLVCIGSSTGGTSALEEILSALPPDVPPIAIVQHMPPEFTGPLAKRLSGVGKLQVREMTSGDILVQGLVGVAPGGQHLRVRSSSGRFVAAVSRGEVVNHHRPSVDVLFGSVAALPHADVLGILLTGMGDDGARGLLALRQAGALTIAQDEATSVVWGMPRVAVELGAAREVLPLGRVAEAIVRWAGEPRVARAS